MIKLSLEVKIHYITLDPEEKKGIRSCLNLGHTFGHALEAMKGYSISHGEGVAWGMARAFEAGAAIGITPIPYRDECIALIKSYGFDTDYRISASEMSRFMDAIGKDKKKKGGAVRFVLMEENGKPCLLPLEHDTVKYAVSND